MKIEKWVIQAEDRKEMAMLYLAEAEICLKTPGPPREPFKNPILGHAAFSTLCAAFQALRTLDTEVLWENLRVSTFFFSFSNGKIEPSNDPIRFAEAVEGLKKYGFHNVTLFRNKSSVDEALEEEPDLELRSYVLCLEEWVAEMYRLAPMIDEKATS